MSADSQACVSQTDLPTKAGVLVFPGFEPLDAIGPIEALQMLSSLRKLDLYVIAPTADAPSSAIPDPRMNAHGSNFGIRIVPTHTFANPPPTSKKATTNKMLWKRITAMVVDGNVWTSGGVTAGIDATLAWIGHVYGIDTARTIANQMEYEWRDDKNWDPFAYMFDETSVAPPNVPS
ncbi:hypothetical protein C8Q80DRAFT_1339052 [Daedaleopsis nitida]|nr:hypothetical protein C8Q80DRAFT_1339052 [Daedaleopsis nitida]